MSLLLSMRASKMQRRLAPCSCFPHYLLPGTLPDLYMSVLLPRRATKWPEQPSPPDTPYYLFCPYCDRWLTCQDHVIPTLPFTLSAEMLVHFILCPPILVSFTWLKWRIRIPVADRRVLPIMPTKTVSRRMYQILITRFWSQSEKEKQTRGCEFQDLPYQQCNMQSLWNQEIKRDRP